MLVDSHCHLDFPDLAARLPEILAKMAANQVQAAVCIGVNLEDFPRVLALAEQAQPGHFDQGAQDADKQESGGYHGSSHRRGHGAMPWADGILCQARPQRCTGHGR